MKLLLVLMSSLSLVDAPESDVIGSHNPVTVTLGDNAILPCYLEPPFDVRTLTVEWKRDEQYVHVSRHGKDYLDDQDENFRGRTSVFHEEMIFGNISLKLTNVTELDAGSYSCFVPKLQSQARRGFINLTVEPVEQKNDKGSQTNNTNTEPGNHGVLGAVATTGISVAVCALLGIAAVLWMKYGNLRGQEREYLPAQRDNAGL